MNLKLSEIANITNGTLIGRDITVTSLFTDSRQVKSGSIFAAIKGENVDGFDFITSLELMEDVAYLTDRAPTFADNPYVVVSDVIQAIGKIANLHLSKLSAKHISVTGSVGKTTTKNFIASALSACMSVHFAKGNFNNELGLPLTALGTDESHDAVILEMGMRGLGQIEYLCSISRPDIAVITNIGVSHIELLGSRGNILKAKSEIIDALDTDGVAILNADDAMLKTLSPNKKTLWYGIDNGDIRAVDIVDNSFTLVYGNKRYPVTLSTLGRHNIYNALAAVAVGIALGCNIESLIKGAESFTGDGSRQNIYEYKGVRIFDDTYNASPDSMRASMNVMGGFSGRRILVLADMLELGEMAPSAHASLNTDIRKINADLVICIGDNMKYLYEALDGISAYHCDGNAKALELLKTHVRTGDNILFKGSNSMRLCDLVKEFKGELEK